MLGRVARACRMDILTRFRKGGRVYQWCTPISNRVCIEMRDGIVAAAHYERLNYVLMSPAAPSGNKPHPADPGGRKRAAAPTGGPAFVRKVRIQRGLTQQGLADLCGMHRNSIQKIETGLTREITAENADALSSALRIRVEDLGLHVRTGAEAPSIRLRQLTAEQRQLVDELLSLPAEDYALLRTAMARLRERRSKRTPRAGRR